MTLTSPFILLAESSNSCRLRTLDFCDEHVRVIVGVAANFVLVEVDLRNLRQDPSSCLHVDAEERADTQGEIK